MLEKLRSIKRIHLIFGLVIFFTIPCYLVGLILFWNNRLERSQTEPEFTVTSTVSGVLDFTQTFTVPIATGTLTPTATLTPTFTSTITYVLPNTSTPTPTNTPTISPTNTAFQTPTLTPTISDTPVPSLTASSTPETTPASE